MKAYVSELFRNSIKSKSVLDFVYLVMMDFSMKYIYIISIVLLFIVFLILLYKTILKKSKQVVESFSTPGTIDYTSDYSTNACAYSTSYNQINTKLKVLLNNSNYHVLHDKIEELNPTNIEHTISKCDRLKEILCDKNYTKIKHFINIGHHDGNNDWMDIAQGNADYNCTPTTFNSNIICTNLTHLLDNFHVIKSGIIDCEPCDGIAYRANDLYCNNCSNCDSSDIFNTSNVDIPTKFYNDVGGGSACLSCGDSGFPATPNSCTNCGIGTGTKPDNTTGECIPCTDSDYEVFDYCRTWSCGTPVPTAYRNRKDTAPLSCKTNEAVNCTKACSPKVDNHYVQIKAKDYSNHANVKCLTKGDDSDNVGLGECTSGGSKTCNTQWVIRVDPNDGDHYRFQYTGGCTGGDWDNHVNNYLEHGGGSCGNGQSTYCGSFETKEYKNEDKFKFKLVNKDHLGVYTKIQRKNHNYLEYDTGENGGIWGSDDDLIDASEFLFERWNS